MSINTNSCLPDLLRQQASDYPQGLAFRQYQQSEWVDYTWAHIAHEVGRWRVALAGEDLVVGDRVALCLHNRVEWVLFDQAALAQGLVVVPLYFDDRPDNMAYSLQDAGVKLLFLEDGDMWSAVRDQAREVQRVVCLENLPSQAPRAVTLHQWLPRTFTTPEDIDIDADALATLVYTSGTTGLPKGVMLSHRNIMSDVLGCNHAVPVYKQDRFLSFLPLSHMFERTVGYYMAIYRGAQTVYARGISLLAEDMLQQRPTILVTVPRIFERILSRLHEQMPVGSFKQRLFAKAVSCGWRRYNGEASLLDKLLWPLWYWLVARKLATRFGGRIRLIITGGAAFGPELARVFVGLGLPVLQGYGLTETGPVICVNREHDGDPASVGQALEGVAVRCLDDGELVTKGDNVMLGYWNQAEATAKVIDSEGWLHTGDIAEIRQNLIYITGRIKDIIVLSNGEKVAPNDIEQAILLDPVFEQVMLVGEKRAKLGLLVKSDKSDLQELCDRANKQLHDFPGYAEICHIVLIDEEWSIENGHLTPTLKLKRAMIEKEYSEQIDKMYQNDLRK